MALGATATDAAPSDEGRAVIDAAGSAAQRPPVADAAGPGADAGAPDLPGPPEPRRDAGKRPVRPDAREPVPLTPHLDAAPTGSAGSARSAGSATVSIGAIPWGNVTLDGKRIGRTPIERLSVTAGHHLIEVVFSGEDPPRSLKYPLDLTDGDSKDVLADFTKP
jgi:hypothetical protein